MRPCQRSSLLAPFLSELQDSRHLFFLLGVSKTVFLVFPFSTLRLFSAVAMRGPHSFNTSLSFEQSNHHQTSIPDYIFIFMISSCLCSERRTTESHHKPSTTKQLQLMPTTSQHTSHSLHVTRPAFKVHTYWETVRRIAWYLETSCVTQNLWRM